jgi:polyhydroxyalkanoate synthesis regulator protein
MLDGDAWGKPMPPQPEPILVKRYARSRLYDTAALRYVTVGDLRDWLTRGVPFVVRDRETGDDITAVLLASPTPARSGRPDG